MSISSSDSNYIQVKVKGLGTYKIVPGTTLGELAEQLQGELAYPAVAGIIGNHLRGFHVPLDRDCEVELVDLSSEMGLKIYQRSAAYLLLKACWDLFPGRRLMIKHTLSNGLYCEFQNGAANDAEIEQISKHMREIVAEDLPIQRIQVKKEEARQIFAAQGQEDTINILEYRDKDKVHIYELEGFYEYFYGYMVNHTSILSKFALINYYPGMVLQTPEKNDIDLKLPYHEQPKLFQVYHEAKAWAGMLETPHLAAMNDIIARDEIDDLIRVNEALQEKKIAQIADMICSNPQIRLVLISGPSSSGKTTFAQRLLIQLRVNGRRPQS